MYIFAPTPSTNPSACGQLGPIVLPIKLCKKLLTSLLGNAILALQTKLGKGVNIMNKDEILAKARKENNGVDEVKLSVQRNASKISLSVGMCACMLFNFVDSIILQTDIIGSVCWIIYGIMVSTDLWVQGICLKKKFYFMGAILTTIFVILLTIFLFLG